MLILFEHGTPRGIIRALSEHTVVTAQSKGWDRLKNGALLNAAEEAGIDVLLSTDRGIRYQQNLLCRKIALGVWTGATRWSRVRLYSDQITAAFESARPGAYAEVRIPFK